MLQSTTTNWDKPIANLLIPLPEKSETLINFLTFQGETSKAQFASSPNLSGLGSIREDATKSRLKRFDSASTSNLLKPSPKTEGRLSKLKRISPNIFRTKKDSPSANADKSDGKSRLQSKFILNR